MKERKKRATKPIKNPPLITSAKNYTKNKQIKKTESRTLGQMVKVKLYR